MPKLHFGHSSTKQLTRQYSQCFRNRLSQSFIPITKDKSASSTDLKSHALLLKGGFIRQSGAGIYSLLPFGLRTIEKIERIIDAEMQAIGCQKLSLPTLLNPDNWKKTGRWNGVIGEFFRFKDRKESDMLLAPTHEEEITQLIANDLRTIKQLPIRLYQIGRKYRDELRPRAGLLRGREFIMKDLYSFDATQEEAYITYEQAGQAYQNIFNRIGVPFVVAEADSGNIGGSKSHEYHLLSNIGEDTLLTCQKCGYTANEELAVGKYNPNREGVMTEEHWNNNDMLKWLRIGSRVQATLLEWRVLSNRKIKGQNDNSHVKGLAAVLTPFGREANTLKVQASLNTYLRKQQKIDNNAVLDIHITNELPKEISNLQHLFLDTAVSIQLPEEITNSADITIHQPDHYRLAKEGDHCVSRECENSNNELSCVKAIECGHTFYLGTKYSSALNCTYANDKNEKLPVEMGCYGIGISRLLAAIAEIRADSKGIVWPQAIAPFKFCIVTTNSRKPELNDFADKVYDQLKDSVLMHENDIMIDDRNIGFGEKMTDAELIGYPYTVIVGPKALQDGQLEIKERIQFKESHKTTVPLNELVSFFKRELCVQ
ncbi:hypothetical protein BDF20DRAFT_974642 [Mycotypha africana]|uniref:uncharacterized protein n=1 Tax=Mycotypha africana TaxID=64632 RepID=UPI002300A055|nr:uncharacterized protein BDF20DRAFT_974642 [Mycotypha africana]KAI8979581.1 hypothetical protein BDF20DRAFT_974642 [Mycotypha africana]